MDVRIIPKKLAGTVAPPSSKSMAHRAILAAALAQGLLDRGLELVSGGTDNHLMLLDLRRAGVTGKELERRLDEVYITVNKNAIPNDPEKPFVTSGIRVGTPAVTTRGTQAAASVRSLAMTRRSSSSTPPVGAKRTTARISGEKPPNTGARTSSSTGTLYRPAVIWSREAKPTTSDSRITDTAPTAPKRMYQPNNDHDAPDITKHSTSTATVRPKATSPRASTICSAVTFASMSVRSVCFSFSSASP